GTYNKTLANNVVVNSGGYRINYINGTNNPVTVVNDPTRSQVNVTISSTGSGGGVTSLNALTGALAIACVTGNTTCSSNGINIITINTAWNIVTTGLSAQTITKALTLNSLILGGNADGNSKNFTSLSDTNSTRFFQGTSRVIDTITGSAPIQAVKSGGSYTVSCSTCGTGSGTVTGSQNVGHAANSVGVLATASSTTIKGRIFTGTSPITITKTNDTDVAVGCSTCLTSAITSLNGQSGPSVNIVCQTGNTTCTNSTNQIKIGFGVNPVITGGSPQTISKLITSTGGLTMSSSNIDLGTNQITRSGHFTVLDLTSGTLLHTNGTFLGTHSSGSLGTSVTVTSLNNAGHASTFPLTTGTLCQTNMTGTCGTNSGVTSITGTAHNVTASASTGAVTLNTGDGVVQTGLSAQTVTKPIKLNQLNASSSLVDNNDNTKKLTWLLSGMTTGKTLTIRSNQTTSQGLNIPDISNTDTVDLLGLSQSITGTKTLTSSNNNFTSQFYIDHSIYKNDQGGSIELGGSGKNPVTNGEPYIDWHFGNGKAQDFNIRTINVANNAWRIQNPTSGPVIDFGDTIVNYVKNNWIPIADSTGANGIWKSSTNADVLKYRNNADSTTYNILSTLGAVTTSTPADPTGTTSTTAKMMGLAGSITPAVSTRIDVTICGQMANSLINDGVTVQLRYGTGTAPTNGATLTGTQLGASQTNTEKVAAQNDGFCVTGIATGLTIGTAYWLDAAVNAVTGGTASITGITIKANEI